MSNKEELLEAIQDIEMALTSLASIKSVHTKDEALKIFEDTFVVIAGICTSVQAKVLSQ